MKKLRFDNARLRDVIMQMKMKVVMPFYKNPITAKRTTLSNKYFKDRLTNTKKFI